MPRTINGRFRLFDEAGRRGGFSEVFRAYDLDSEPLQQVAIKLLSPGAHPDAIANMAVAREFESLMRLRHENIVRLIEADVDAESGAKFLALEWVDSSMESYLDGGVPEPDDFIGGIGLDISRAMAFAHDNGVAHRDLKPSNVLMTADGKVKIADFGISRVVDLLEARSVNVAPTLADYASPPWAPPERDVGPLARDVWGLGATLLAGLVKRPLADYEDLRRARDELDVIDELRDIVMRCLDESQVARPADCRVVSALVERFWRKRQVRAMGRSHVYIGVSMSAAEYLDEADPDSAARAVVADLRDSPTIVVARNDRGGERQYLLYGEAWAYRVAIDNGRNPLPRLVVVTAYVPTASEADRAREQGLVLEYVDFRAGAPADRGRAEEAIERVLDDADRHEAEVLARRRESEASRLLDQWRRQIEARSKAEFERERPVAYSHIRRDGRRGVFTATGSVDGIEVGEIRRAVPTAGPPLFVRGEVEDVDGNKVTLYLDVEVEGIPASGKLVVDTQPSKVKIQREKSAIDILAHTPAKAARSDLAQLLFNPGTAQPPTLVEVDQWASERLDESKRAAVKAALGAPDLFLVQGPPGTGKTTFIAELVAQQLLREPRSRILISSQTNVALDNALDRIERIYPDTKSPRIIRLADPKHGKVGADAERFRVEEQLRKWRTKAEVKSNAFLEQWVLGRGVSVDVVNESKFLREVASRVELAARVEQELADLEPYLDRVRPEGAEPLSEDEVNERLQDILDRMQELELERRRFEQSNRSLANKYQEVVDRGNHQELQQLADDLLGGTAAAIELRGLVQLQADWLQRLGRGEGFVAALAQDSSVIGATCIGLAAVQDLADVRFDLCIIDECSKATATETIVPMVRARKWILVGDERQLPPMVEDALRDRSMVTEFQLDERELHTTLFTRLAQGLPGPCQTMLNEQHRMVKPIGDLISECFYDGELKSVGPETAVPVPGVMPKPVTWHDTSRLADRVERKPVEHEHSYVNTTEARVAAELVRQLASRAKRETDAPSVLVIAPYAAQIRELKRRIDQLGQIESVSVEVATVDSVQGREADYVVFCVTRSNPSGDAGFLGLDARANVALSRAKKGLAIVGDLSFCRTAKSPFREVAHFVSSHPESCARVEVSR